MARVLVKRQPWGTLWERDITTRALRAPLAGQAASISTTVYTAPTGTTPVTSFVTDSNGDLPGWVEEGTHALTVNSVATQVEAVSATRISVLTVTPINVDYPEHNGSVSSAIAALSQTRGGLLIVPDKSTPRDQTAPLVLPPGTRMVGAGRYAAHIRNATTDVLQLGISTAAGTGISIEGIRFESLTGGGHVIVPGPLGMDRCEFRDTWLVQNNAAKSVLRSVNVPFVGNQFFSGQSDHVDAATVPGWHLVTPDGSVTANNWHEGWWHYYSGEYAFHLEQTAAGSYVYDNRIAVVAEICRGGLVKILSGQGNLIDGVRNWDMQAIGASTRDGIVIGKSALGPASVRNHIIRPTRSAGVLGTGLKDITLTAGGSSRTTITDPENATLTGYTIDLGSTAQNLLLGFQDSVTVQNRGAATIQVLHDAIRFGNSDVLIKSGGPGRLLIDAPGGARTYAVGAGTATDEDGTFFVDDLTNNVKRLRIGTTGDVTCLTQGAGFVLRSPNGNRWRINISDAGAVTTTNLGA